MRCRARSCGGRAIQRTWGGFEAVHDPRNSTRTARSDLIVRGDMLEEERLRVHGLLVQRLGREPLMVEVVVEIGDGLSRRGSARLLPDPMPHCDILVLHAPEDCHYCAQAAELQEERRRLRVRNTGAPNQPGRRYQCPAELRRGLAELDRWGGNRKVSEEDAAALGLLAGPPIYAMPDTEEDFDGDD